MRLLLSVHGYMRDQARPGKTGVHVFLQLEARYFGEGAWVRQTDNTEGKEDEGSADDKYPHT